LEQQRITELTRLCVELARMTVQNALSRERSWLIHQRSLLLVGAWIACVVGGPAPATAQFGPPSDPICRLRTSYDDSLIVGQLEYDVKAALLYRCLELVQWPGNVSASEPPTLTVGILGKNPFGESLDCLRGKTIGGRKLVVTKLSRVSHASRCHLLFISASETKRTAKILDSLAPLPVLTIGEIPGFTEQGGIINLLLEGKNIRLEINQAAAEKVHLQIDPKLIKLASLMAEPISERDSSSGSSGPTK
jgi:hypothetical protein